MSFILDALKKLEQEKAARRGGNVNISDEILRGNHRVSRTSKRTVPLNSLVVGFVFVLLIMAVAATVMWRQRGVVRETESTPVEVSAGTQQPILAERAPAPPAPGVRETTPAREAAPLTPRIEPLPVPPQSNASRTGAPSRTSPPSIISDRGGDSYQGDASAGSNLTVSGIAWQDERSSRRAVVNGVLLSEGKKVGGAKVVEILQNSVRFSSNGRTFEVSLSSPQQGR
jgi:general secretion pathway protein B